MEDEALLTSLERLAEADILLVQGLPPESEYRFKHALIQNAAYENLLKSRRKLCTAARVNFCAISLPPLLRPNRSCSRITSRRQG
jgi:predicted ATPase